MNIKSTCSCGATFEYTGNYQFPFDSWLRQHRKCIIQVEQVLEKIIDDAELTFLFSVWDEPLENAKHITKQDIKKVVNRLEGNK